MNDLLYQSNLRLLNILRVKKLISKKKYEVTKTVLENELTKGRQPLLDAVEPFKGILQNETLWREFFKYNQIFLKLSRQFITNTLSPKLKDIGDSKDNPFFDLDKGAFPFSRLCRRHWIVRGCHEFQTIPTPCFKV